MRFCLEKDLGLLVDAETEEEHWAADYGHVRIRRYMNQGAGFMLSRVDKGDRLRRARLSSRISGELRDERMED